MGEILSVPLCPHRLHEERASIEAGVKYLILAVSSAFLLFGIALHAETGTMDVSLMAS
jgi:NADH:ubiquinone oxidoreductase subunit 2 (subunit N)